MIPAAFALSSRQVKKQVMLVLAMTVIILSLPFMAVFAIGTSALSFLASSPSDTTGNNAIATQTVGLYEGPPVSGDYYAWGNCTYWVFFLRQQANNTIPTSWGNASTWAFYAQIDGYLVDHTPLAGAIMQISNVDNNLGHVAYVTAVDPATGAWTISEMNVQGLDIVDIKTLPASAANEFNFIHNKEGTV